MRTHGYLVVDLYPTTPDSCRLRTNTFPGENNRFHPYDILHTISPIVDSFKKKNYMESAELQAMHKSKKQMDLLMGHHDLPSEIKAQEIGKAQDRHLLFRNRPKSDESVKSKGILEPKNISSPESTIFVPENEEPHDSSLNVVKSSELPPGCPDIELSEIEDSMWNELPYKEEQTQPTFPLMLSTASVMDTPQNVPWSNHPA